MGSALSQEAIEKLSLTYYEFALQQSCLLPDVGIDESILKYSGTDSNAVLNAYSNELVASVPGFVEKLGSGLGALTVIPNAVGLGALVISMIIEISVKSSTEPSEDSYSMFRRVFGEEKASAVRDTMSEYVKRHRVFMNNNQELLEELERLEEQLSNQLSILRNSLLHDGQMSSRGFKIWVNGASFHIQMLIHDARLTRQSGKSVTQKVNSIKALTGVYLQQLNGLLDRFKSHMISSTDSRFNQRCVIAAEFSNCELPTCILRNTDAKCERHMSFDLRSEDGCGNTELIAAYIEHVFSKHEAITGLKSHFSDFETNLDTLINQHDSYVLPSTE